MAQLSLVRSADEGRDELANGSDAGYTLKLGHSIGSGRTYRCYKVKQTNLVPAECNLVAKVVNLSAFPVRDCKGSRSRHATKQAAKAEAALYEGPLAPLQGDTVPRFFGLWMGTAAWHAPAVSAKDFAFRGSAEKRDHSHEIMIMLLEDVGRTIADRSEYVGDFDACVHNLGPCTDVRVDIVDLYERLHGVNVVHNDFGVKHVMKSGMGDLRLIDFEDSWEVNPDKPKEYVDLLDEKRALLREFKQPVPPELENLVPPWEM